MNTEDIKIEAIAVHQIGDKSLKEPLILSQALLQLSDDQIIQLKSFFLNHFKGQEFHNFRLIDGQVNPSRLPHIVDTVFEDPESLHSQSCEVARMLYSFTESETLNEGLLYLCHLKDVLIEDEMVDALGIYFCPLDDSFLTVHDLDSQPQLHFSFGTYLGKHEMAALIYNADRELGYKIDIIDKSKKNTGRPDLDGAYFED